MKGEQFVTDSITRVRRDGIEGVENTLYRLYKILWERVDRVSGPILGEGIDAYERRWDVLIVLDGCRADLMAAVADEYDFVTGVPTVRSNASKTRQWMEETFSPDRGQEMAETAYVTGNPFSDVCLRSEDFAALEEVWSEEWDETLGTVPAEPITDRAISRWRSGDYERMIVHYMQPHFPSVPNPELGSELHPDRFGQAWDSIWERLRDGEVAEGTVRAAYRKNVEYVLESVKLLVRSIDAERVVITADHGNSFGSWGLYGHPRAPVAAVRNIPWCELSAQDVSGYEPTTTAHRDAERDRVAGELDEGVESKLRDLGYL